MKSVGLVFVGFLMFFLTVSSAFASDWVRPFNYTVYINETTYNIGGGGGEDIDQFVNTTSNVTHNALELTESLYIENILDTYSIRLMPEGDAGSSSSVGGALNILNSGNPGSALVIYSNEDNSADGHLVQLRTNNPLFDRVGMFIDYSGTSHGLSILNRGGSGTSSAALNLDSYNDQDSTQHTAGNQTGRGVSKITHDNLNSANDADSSGISIDVKASDGGTTWSRPIFVDCTVGECLGDRLNLRNNGFEKFVVDSNGSVDMQGSLTVEGQITSQGEIVCLENGTNCPASSGGGGIVIDQNVNASSEPYFNKANVGEYVEYNTSANNQVWQAGLVGDGNFSIYDSRHVDLPFVIEADAPDEAFFIQRANGDVGLGTNDPDEELHIYGGNALTRVKIESTTNQAGFQIINNAGQAFAILDRTTGDFTFLSNENIIFRSAGGENIGFGLTTPLYPIHMEGLEMVFDGTAYFNDTIYSMSVPVCLENGTNCPSDVDTDTWNSTSDITAVIDDYTDLKSFNQELNTSSNVSFNYMTLGGNLTLTPATLGYINNLRGIRTVSNSAFFFDQFGSGQYYFRDSDGNTILQVGNDDVTIPNALSAGAVTSQGHEICHDNGTGCDYVDSANNSMKEYVDVTEDRGKNWGWVNDTSGAIEWTNTSQTVGANSALVVNGGLYIGSDYLIDDTYGMRIPGNHPAFCSAGFTSACVYFMLSGDFGAGYQFRNAAGDQIYKIRIDGNQTLTSENGSLFNCGITNTGEYSCH